MSFKIKWQGKIISIQPRTRVWRYVLDNRTHYYIGYNLFLDGYVEGRTRSFAVAISEKQQFDNLFRIGNTIKGTAWTKKYPEREYADFYRAGALKILKNDEAPVESGPPPWLIEPPALSTYERRGPRLLSLSLWKGKCFQCIWANMSNVEIIWNFDTGTKRYRFETFCYGPISCRFYKMGRPRSVPYKDRCGNFDDGCFDELFLYNRESDDE
jgi:hypothetical protein